MPGRHRLRALLSAVFVLWILAGCSGTIVHEGAGEPSVAKTAWSSATVFSATPFPTYAPQPTYTTQLTYTPFPTYTLVPTYTPRPTYTLAPTYTAQPPYAPSSSPQPTPVPASPDAGSQRSTSTPAGRLSEMPTGTAPQLTANVRVNVRGGPGTAYPAIGTADAGACYPLTGRDASGGWWQIAYGGMVGWIFAELAQAEGAESVPIVEEVSPPPAPSAAPLSTATAEPADPCRYIGNKNSGKLHLATCEWVTKMNPENKVCFAVKEEAIAQGYEPCKVCNP